MAACVLAVKILTLPMSVIVHLVSKALTVRRGWTAVACNHVRMVRWGSQSGQGWGWGLCVAQIILGGNAALYVLCALSPGDMTPTPMKQEEYSS